MKKSHILVVDDVKENIQILTAILRYDGYSVTSSMDGYEALKLVKQQNFDLILLDIMMPEISGLEVCRYLKIDPATTNIPVIFLTANQEKNILTKAFNVGGIDYIKKPYFKEELLARVRAALKIRHYEKDLEEEVKRRTKEMQEAQIHLMRMLGGVAEGHSIETYQHVKRVGEITYILAKRYGFDSQKAQTLKYASYLHDIGKIGIKDYILHKEEKLTKKEFEEIKKHPKLGAAMLSGVKLPLFEVAKIISEQHHEKWDGSGYPNKYKQEQIHIYARIVAIADVFDALSSKRSYKEGWGMQDTLEFLKQESGKHFDPHLIKLLFEDIDPILELYGTSQKKLHGKPSNIKKKSNWLFEWLLKER